MERPHATIEAPQDNFDHELTQPQADFIALTDVLLAHKRDGGMHLSFTDIVVQHSPDEVEQKLRATRVGQLMRPSDAQLAIESDGSYYPQLDLKKANGRLAGVSIRAWGWDDKKYRYTDPGNTTVPREYKKYQGEIDKTRQLDISFSYTIGDTSVVESISLYGSTTAPDYVYATSQVWASPYAETGYEGHGDDSIDELSDAEVYEFLELVADMVGDTPESYGEMYTRQTAALRCEFEGTSHFDGVSRLIDLLWPAQACYELLERPYANNETIVSALRSGDAERQRTADEALAEAVRYYEQMRKRTASPPDA